VPYARNVNPEWGYVAPAPSVMRMARLILVAAIIGATAGAATVFSLLDRPVAQESVAARTLVAPDSRGRLTASTSVAAQQPTAPNQVKSPNEVQNTEQKATRAPGARPQPIELATTSTSQGPTSTAALAETPAVKDVLSAQTLTDTVAVAANPAPAPKPQSKKPRTTSRIVSRTDASRYDGRGYDRYLDEPRYGYKPRYGYEPRYGSRGSFAW
jgi:hypothetical protein